MAVVRCYELTYADTTSGIELCFDVYFTVDPDLGVDISEIKLGQVAVSDSFSCTDMKGIADRILEAYKNGDWDY